MADTGVEAPEAHGFRPGVQAAFDAAMKAGRLPNIHGVVALKGGAKVFEHYGTGEDEIWGTPQGVVAYDAGKVHDLRSVTKSIVGLLYGIARHEGKVPAVETPLLDAFPGHDDLKADPRRARMTLRHVLTMTMAQDWNENLPYSDPRNSEIMMEQAKDRVRFVLERKILGEPGSGFIYGGGATMLLGKLIERGTGMDLHAYARERLFAPLGIAQSEWTKGTDGAPAAASGLRLSPRDLARIGEMILAKGAWAGRQVVPAEWLGDSFTVRALSDEGRHFGYHWYLGEMALIGMAGVYGTPWVGAFGYGGQRLFVFPQHDFVLSVTAGNYAAPDQWKPPIVILREVFLANIKA